jgi:YidC/Oxa1 family membrane protein insertase
MGLAIGVLSVSTRLALLPLTLRLAYRSLEKQAAIRKLEPKLANLREKYKSDPRTLMAETSALYREHGIQIIDGGILGVAIQAPIFLGLFGAVRRGLAGASRFLWIKDLAKPDALLAGGFAVLTGLSLALGPSVPTQNRVAMIVLPMALSLLFAWKLAAGLTIYSFASGLVGVGQALLVRRRAARFEA